MRTGNPIRVVLALVAASVFAVWILSFSLALAAGGALEGPGYLSVPAAAFAPIEAGQHHYNTGAYIEGPPEFTPRNYYNAAVALPDGATIEGVQVFFEDDSGLERQGAVMWLLRTYAPADISEPASTAADVVVRVETVKGGWVAAPAPQPGMELVDNENYFYYLQLRMDHPGVKVQGARIGYKYSRNVPSALRDF